MTEKGDAPLAGYRILEVSHFLAGPYCGLLLGDLGAEVIKIEPEGGEVARTVSPHSVGPHNLYFASLTRNKKGVTLNLASPEGQERLGRLAASAHGLLTNLRPSAIKKLGLTYEALRKWNDKLVCVSLTGYGLEGPHAEKPAFDYAIQAQGGAMALTGEPGSPPTRVGYSVVDNTTGMMAALGLVAKILSGKGGQVDVAMHDVLLSQMNFMAAGWLNAGEEPRRLPMGAHPYFVPAQLFETREGHLVIFITHDASWRQFAEAAGRPDWCADPAFATMAARLENRERVIAAVAALFREDSAVNWVRRLAPRGVVISDVRTLPEALDSEVTRDREMVASMETPGGTLRGVGNPIKVPGWKTAYRPPPLLGEHNEALLGEANEALLRPDKGK